MGRSTFQFREFSVRQEQSAAKLGSDSVVLGAWANTNDGRRVLDLGTGTGILALMTAQRNPSAQIDAVESDPASAAEAHFNFQHSPWSDRLRLIQSNALDFVFPEPYDHIISNPPYFPSTLPSQNPSRRKWRTADSLTPAAMLTFARKHLTPTGRLSLILPTESARAILALAPDHTLHLTRHTHLIHKYGKPATRALLAFSRSSQPLRENELVLQISHDKDLSEEAQELLYPFYPWITRT